MYPDTITTRTRDRWLDQAERGQQVDMRWDVVRQDLNTQAAELRQQQIGSSGQSYGFGGAGGGGGGGSSLASLSVHADELHWTTVCVQHWTA